MWLEVSRSLCLGLQTVLVLFKDWDDLESPVTQREAKPDEGRRWYHQKLFRSPGVLQCTLVSVSYCPYTLPRRLALLSASLGLISETLWVNETSWIIRPGDIECPRKNELLPPRSHTEFESLHLTRTFTEKNGCGSLRSGRTSSRTAPGSETTRDPKTKRNEKKRKWLIFVEIAPSIRMKANLEIVRPWNVDVEQGDRSTKTYERATLKASRLPEFTPPNTIDWPGWNGTDMGDVQVLVPNNPIVESFIVNKCRKSSNLGVNHLDKWPASGLTEENRHIRSYHIIQSGAICCQWKWMVSQDSPR